ncbi:basic proline-rich protein [Hyaena hyaena]|uniref:basic proline-rich protein n=1 Tax=Hyaena hyaena TaxID=95912 RepID=UPI001920CB55|nr:basic proline-rich protein [Hyaena hyaena]
MNRDWQQPRLPIPRRKPQQPGCPPHRAPPCPQLTPPAPALDHKRGRAGPGRTGPGGAGSRAAGQPEEAGLRADRRAPGSPRRVSFGRAARSGRLSLAGPPRLGPSASGRPPPFLVRVRTCAGPPSLAPHAGGAGTGGPGQGRVLPARPPASPHRRSPARPPPRPRRTYLLAPRGALRLLPREAPGREGQGRGPGSSESRRASSARDRRGRPES